MEVRFIRQTKALSVPYHGSPTKLIRDFLSIYAHHYGEAAVPELAGFELVTFLVAARGALRRPALARPRSGSADPFGARRGTRPVYDPLAAAFLPTAIFAGERLVPGNAIEGPAVIEYPTTTLTLCSGQRADVNELLGIEIRTAS